MAARITQLIRDATGGNKPPRGALTRWAEQIDTSASTVSRWRGGTIPDAEWWPVLARVLNVTETEIAEAAGQAPREPTNADLDRKIQSVLVLVQQIADNQRRRRIERDETPREMPRPALHRDR